MQSRDPQPDPLEALAAEFMERQRNLLHRQSATPTVESALRHHPKSEAAGA